MKKLWNKISFRLIILTAIVFVPVLIVLFFFNIQTTNNAARTMIQENQGNLDTAAKQLDNVFEVTESLLKTINNETTILDIIRSYGYYDRVNYQEYLRAANRLRQHLDSLLSTSDILEYAFIYFPDQELFYNSKQDETMSNYVYGILDTNILNKYQKSWTPVYLDNHWYLLRIWVYNRYYVGTWYSADELMDAIHVNYNYAQDLLYISNSKGTYLTTEGIYVNPSQLSSGDFVQNPQRANQSRKDESPQNYYYIYSSCNKAPIRLVKLLNTKTVKDASPNISMAIGLIFAGFIILILLYTICTRRWLLRPLKITMHSMDVIGSGDIHYRIPVNPRDCSEFTRLGETFNTMMDQVNQLKNEIYEGQLERQEIRLEYLQQQIQPHFILNTLNTLYNHTEDEIQKEIILLMTKYYRFVVNVDSRYVQLGQELEHINNYLKLQKVRYPQAFDYIIHCADALEIVPVPPFLIESFVGNTIKHALNFTDCVTIRVEAFL